MKVPSASNLTESWAGTIMRMLEGYAKLREPRWGEEEYLAYKLGVGRQKAYRLIKRAREMAAQEGPQRPCAANDTTGGVE